MQLITFLKRENLKTVKLSLMMEPALMKLLQGHRIPNKMGIIPGHKLEVRIDRETMVVQEPLEAVVAHLHTEAVKTILGM
jgi:hypothetical protein